MLLKMDAFFMYTVSFYELRRELNLIYISEKIRFLLQLIFCIFRCDNQYKTTMVVRLHPGQSRRLSDCVDMQVSQRLQQMSSLHATKRQMTAGFAPALTSRSVNDDNKCPFYI